MRHGDRHPAVRPLHDAGRGRARTRCWAPCPRRTVRWLGPEAGPVRDESHTATLVADGGVGGRAAAGHRGGARRLRHARADERRARAGLAARGARAQPLHHVGLHRLAVAGRRRDPGRAWRPPATGSSWRRWRSSAPRPTSRRVVEQGKVITAAGVSSGIDMALRLAELLYGPEAAQAVQLAIEYDPQPPFDAGSPEKAPGADRGAGPGGDGGPAGRARDIATPARG